MASSGFGNGFTTSLGSDGFGSGFSSPVNVVPEGGLLLHLDASNSTSYPGSGATWYDLASSPAANNATLINTPTYSTAAGGYFTFAKVSSESATVSGTGLVPSAAYTKAVWFNLTDTSSDNNIVSGEAGGHFMYMAGSNKLYCGHSNVLPYDANASVTSFSAGTWYFAVVTYTSTGNVMKLYVNGALDATFSIAPHAGDGSTNIGRFGAGNFLNGSVAQVLTYDRDLAAADVTRLYNATKSRFGL